MEKAKKRKSKGSDANRRKALVINIFNQYHREEWGKELIMGDFEVIETQEQLDKVIGEQIKKERENIEKKFEGYLSPEAVAEKYKEYLSPEDAKKKYEGYLSPEEASKKDAQIRSYEAASVKMRIANEVGLPYEMAARLSGEDEDAIRKDAQALQKLMGRKPEAPLADPESGKGTKDAGLRAMLHQLNGKGE